MSLTDAPTYHSGNIVNNVVVMACCSVVEEVHDKTKLENAPSRQLKSRHSLCSKSYIYIPEFTLTAKPSEFVLENAQTRS